LTFCSRVSPTGSRPHAAVTAITRRRDAILTSIISQVTPSESSLIKRIGMEPLFRNFLRDTLGIKGIQRVSMHEPLDQHPLT
jgi:4-hydroxy-3-polyprenylbenzoate decarboxylase